MFVTNNYVFTVHYEKINNNTTYLQAYNNQ